MVSVVETSLITTLKYMRSPLFKHYSYSFRACAFCLSHYQYCTVIILQVQRQARCRMVQVNKMEQGNNQVKDTKPEYIKGKG